MYFSFKNVLITCFAVYCCSVATSQVMIDFTANKVKDRILNSNASIVDRVSRLHTQVEDLGSLLSETNLLLDSEFYKITLMSVVRDTILSSRKERGFADLSKEQVLRFAKSIVFSSEIYEVRIPLVLAVIETESRFNAYAKSSAGALGAMQIMPSTAEYLSLRMRKDSYDLYSIDDNVSFGVYYLMILMDRYNGNLKKTLQAYNCGPTCVSRVYSGEYSEFPEETQKYVVLVENAMKHYVERMNQ